jgi:hypothetical protein
MKKLTLLMSTSFESINKILIANTLCQVVKTENGLNIQKINLCNAKHRLAGFIAKNSLKISDYLGNARFAHIKG